MMSAWYRWNRYLDGASTAADVAERILTASPAIGCGSGRRGRRCRGSPAPRSAWGASSTMKRAPRDLWRIGWDAINGKRAPWSANPWVWVLSFRQAQNGDDE